MALTDKRFAVALYDVKIDGRTQDSALAGSLEEVVVEDCVNRPAMFCLNYMILKPVRQGIAGVTIQDVNDDLFEQFTPGAEIDVELGINEKIKMLSGRVTSIEPDYNYNSPRLAIRGYDGMFYLRFGTKRRSFTEIKDSTVAQQIASEIGLAADVTDTSTIHPYIFQNNQSNYEFLLERGARLDYELLVEGRTLRFGPPREDREPEVELYFGPSTELKRFSAQLKTLTQNSEVEFRGWDANRKAAISSKARGGDELVIARDGQRTGFQYATDGFRASQAAIIDEPLIDDADAENLARAAYRRSLRNFISGEGAAVGNPEIRAGRTIRLQGLGSKFSGVYYVVSSRHKYSAQGYETTFKVRRPNI